MRYDAAVVAQEVEEARMMEAELARQAHADFRKEKNEEFKSKVEEHRKNIKAKFDSSMPIVKRQASSQPAILFYCVF